jgi:hypothetical protein
MKKFISLSSLLIISFNAFANTGEILVHGTQAMAVGLALKSNGIVEDGVRVPEGELGMGSRVFGTYEGKPASCVYPWGKAEPAECSIAAGLSMDTNQESADDLNQQELERLGGSIH